MERDEEIKLALDAYRDGRTDVDANGHRCPKPYEEQVELWKRMWDVVDFSWQALEDAGWQRANDANDAQKLKRWKAPPNFPNGGVVLGEGDRAYIQATLMDYWRWFPNEDWTADQGFAGGRLLSDTELIKHGLLVEPRGRLFHAIHGHNEVREPLRKAIVIRLELARSGANAILTGVNVRNLGSTFSDFAKTRKPRRPIFVSAELADLHGIDASYMSFGEDTSFYRSKFGVGTRFWYADFGDKVNFSESIFGDFAIFFEAQFGSRVSFERTVFGRAAEFAFTNFTNRAWFSKATLGDDASFDSVDFGNSAFFNEVSFGNRTRLNEAVFGSGASFNSSEFGDETDFTRASFEGYASFESVDFGGRVHLDETTFKGLDLSHATFSGIVSAKQMTCAGCFRMRAAEVASYADFSDAVWPEKLEDQHAAFEGCRFRDVANFKTKDFSAFAMFDGAVFANNLLLTEPVTGQPTPDQLFDLALQAAKDAAERDESASCDLAKQHREWKANEKRKPDDEPQDPTPDERGEDARYGALAGGLRTLRRAMAAQGDIDREQRFYRYELKARAQRPSEPKAAKIAASIYRRVSDYGASIGRPIIMLMFSLVFFGVIYSWIGWKLGIQVEGSKLSQAFSLSLNNSFRPFSALSAKDFDEGTLGRLLLTHSDGIKLLLQGIAILQSLTALLLLFLFGLALRRRFRIS
jgi:hypothetical protein